MDGISAFEAAALGVGGLGVLLVLFVIARSVGWAVQLHLLKVEAHRLRSDHERRMQSLRQQDDPTPFDGEIVDLGKVEDHPDLAAHLRAAA